MRSSVKKSKAGSQNIFQNASKAKRPFFDQNHSPEPFFQKASTTANTVSLKSTTESYGLLETGVPSPEVTSTSGNVLMTVYFAQNSSLLLSDNYRAVERLADQLQTMNNPAIVVDGYASAEGADQYNQELSERRRFAVKSILSAKAGDLNIQGTAHGESSPAIEESAGNPAEIERQRSLNRRASIFITTDPETKPLDLSIDFSSKDMKESGQNLKAKIPKKQTLFSQVIDTKEAIEDNLFGNVPKAWRPVVKDTVYELLKNIPKKKVQILFKIKF